MNRTEFETALARKGTDQAVHDFHRNEGKAFDSSPCPNCGGQADLYRSAVGVLLVCGECRAEAEWKCEAGTIELVRWHTVEPVSETEAEKFGGLSVLDAG
jgi:hypothetical protein